jgi:hypothetical protein
VGLSKVVFYRLISDYIIVLSATTWAEVPTILDCWMSPFSQAFMAVTGYLIDED